jgi:hypothetical protein
MVLPPSLRHLVTNPRSANPATARDKLLPWQPSSARINHVGTGRLLPSMSSTRR